MAGKSLLMFLLLASISVLIKSSMCSTESVAMTKASEFAENAQTFTKGIQELMNPETVRLVSKVIQNVLGSLSGTLGPLSGLLGMFAAFIPTGESAELAYMKEAFAKIDQSLARIEESLYLLSSKISWQTVQLSFEDDENDILTIHQDMRRALQTFADDSVSTATKEYAKMDFIEKYKSRDIEGAMNTLYNGITMKCTMCQGKILDVLKENAKCDRKEVVAFMTSLLQVFVKGEQAAMAYHQWSGVEGSSGFVDRLMNSWTQMHDGLQAEYENTLEYCRKNFISYLKDEIDTIHERNSKSTTEQEYTNMIQQHVSTKYDWLEFSVGVYMASDTHTHYDLENMYDGGNEYYGINSLTIFLSSNRHVFIGWREKSPMSAMIFLIGRQVIEDQVNDMWDNKYNYNIKEETANKLKGYGVKVRYILTRSFTISSKPLFFFNVTESDGSFYKYRKGSGGLGYKWREVFMMFAIDE